MGVLGLWTPLSPLGDARTFCFQELETERKDLSQKLEESEKVPQFQHFRLTKTFEVLASLLFISRV